MARPRSVQSVFGKSIDLDLGQAVAHGALDHGGGQLDLFVFGKAGWLAEPVDQRAFLGFRRRHAAGYFVGLLGLLEGRLLLDFLGRGQQIVDFQGMGDPSYNDRWRPTFRFTANLSLDPDQALCTAFFPNSGCGGTRVGGRSKGRGGTL